MFLRKNSKKIKIFVVSIVVLENYNYKITYLLDKKLENEYFRGLFQSSFITNNINLMLKMKVGEWVGVSTDDMGHFICIFN